MICPLISVACLSERLEDENLRIIDVSLKSVIGRNPVVYDAVSVIPGSCYIDLSEDLVDHSSSQVHSFPSQKQVQEVVTRLAITANTTVVVYDNQGVYSSPRAWWVFKSFGLANVYILDGGLPEWLKQNYPTSSEYQTTVASSSSCCRVDFCINSIVFKQQVLANLSQKKFTVIDVRASARFSGKVQEPRKGVRSGHIPNAINLPFELALCGNKYKSSLELQNLFSSLVQDNASRLVFSCGSGITACIGLVAALLAKHRNVALYDGSWSEWACDLSLPIE